MGTSKKQKKRDGLRYREFVLSPYGVIKIKSLGYNLADLRRKVKNDDETFPIISPRRADRRELLIPLGREGIQGLFSAL